MTLKQQISTEKSVTKQRLSIFLDDFALLFLKHRAQKWNIGIYVQFSPLLYLERDRPFSIQALHFSPFI